MLAMDPARPASPHWRRPIHSIVAGQKAESNGTALPSLGFLDIEKIKREAADNDQLKNPTSATTISTAPSLTSPQSMYPAPPFSYPSSSASSVHGLTGYISPPESRRTSDDDKDAPGRARISLPSIHDALGKDPSMLYSSGPPSSVSIPASSSSQVSAMSPTVSIPRSHPDPILPGPRNPYTPVPPVHSSQPLSYYGGESQDHRGPPILRQGSFSDNPSLSRVSAHDSAPASAHSASPTSPIPPVRPSPHLLHPTQVPPPYPPGPPSIAPQPSYRPFQPAFSYPPHTPGTVGYAPANYNNQPTWRGDGFEIDRAEEVRKAAAKRSPGGGQHYGESVKRHLDIFDLETSLNEIAEGSGRALDFSRIFGQRAHQSQRSGSVSALPKLEEVDDMIRRQNRVLDSMMRIREVVIAQQHALAEQRSRDEANKAHQSEYDGDHGPYQEKQEGGGGFAGPDPKKKRGRNAPPGRCHSCNRAETPEWRRGPDGARTLCNACGLHYAKLTRKMGSKAATGGSNLRPKDADGSP